MISRRTLLATLASLPLCGWLRPARRISRIESPMQLDTTRFEKGFEKAKLQVRKLHLNIYLAPEWKDNAVLTTNEAREANG